MTLYLLDGTTLLVDDGPTVFDEDGNVFFMSDGWPVVILREYALRLIDGAGVHVAEWV